MQLHDPLRDRQAQAGTAWFAGTSLIRSVKALEDVRQVFLANPDSTVANLNSRTSGPVGKVHLDPAAHRRVLHGVFHDNQKQTLDRRTVPRNQNRTGWKLTHNLNPLGCRKN